MIPPEVLALARTMRAEVDAILLARVGPRAGNGQFARVLIQSQPGMFCEESGRAPADLLRDAFALRYLARWILMPPDPPELTGGELQILEQALQPHGRYQPGEAAALLALAATGLLARSLRLLAPGSEPIRAAAAGVVEEIGGILERSRRPTVELAPRVLLLQGALVADADFAATLAPLGIAVGDVAEALLQLSVMIDPATVLEAFGLQPIG